MKRGEAGGDGTHGRVGPGKDQSGRGECRVMRMASETGARSGVVYLVRRVRRSEFEKEVYVVQSPTRALKRCLAIAPRRRPIGTAI